MAFPSDLSRTKDWGTEILTDSDLEGQFDLIINWVMAALNATTGHTHAGTSNQGPKIIASSALTIASQSTGDMLYASSASAWARKAIGSANDILRVSSGIPDWEPYTTFILTPTEYTDVPDTNANDDTTAETSYQDTALSITFTVGKAGLVHATFSGRGDSSSGIASVALVVDGTVKQEVSIPSGVAGVPISLAYTAKLTAASHTIKIQIKGAGGGDCTLKGTALTSRLYVSHPS